MTLFSLLSQINYSTMAMLNKRLHVTKDFANKYSTTQIHSREAIITILLLLSKEIVTNDLY